MNNPNPSQNDASPRRGLLIAAFTALYVIWGSTYLAMRVAVETMPPLLMAGCRFTIAGGLLYGWMRWRGVARPDPRPWRNATITGLLLLLGGNGLIVWAEQTVPSGLAALLVAIVPVWFALLDWLRPNGERPQAKNVAGIIVGLVGVAMLVTGKGALPGMTEPPWMGIGMVLLAGLIWAWGSLFMRYNERPASPFMGIAMQLVAGGLALLVVGVLLGELPRFRPGSFSARSWLALAWLLVGGSWIGYSAYIWLLQVSTPARVATYAYVNPVIAVFLGWLLLHEPVNERTIVAAAVIVAGVVIITLPNALLERWLRLPKWRFRTQRD